MSPARDIAFVALGFVLGGLVVLILMLIGQGGGPASTALLNGQPVQSHPLVPTLPQTWTQEPVSKGPAIFGNERGTTFIPAQAPDVPPATDATKLQMTNGPAPIKGTVVWTDKP